MATEKTGSAVDNDLHIEAADAGVTHFQDVDIHDKALNNAALEATIHEHNVGIWQGLKTYRRAAFWSIRK